MSLHVAGQTLPPNYKPEDYAVWFFDFLRADLAAMSSVERIAMQANAFAFARPELIDEWDQREQLPSVKALADLQAAARQGIQRLQEGRWFRLERGINYGIARFGERIIKGARQGTFSDLFLAAAIDAIANYWERLRICPKCSGLFLKVGKRKFCSPKCAQQANWEAFKSRRTRDYHEEHVKRTKRRYGPNIKVNKRGAK